MFVIIWLILSLSTINDALGWGKEHCQQNGYCVTFTEGEIRAEAGLCAVIPCSFTSDFKSKHIIWYKCQPSKKKCQNSDPVFHSGENNPNSQAGFKGRLSLLDPDVTKRNCSIMINDIKTSDSGSYQLRVEGDTDKYTYTVVRTNLFVTDLKQKPSVMIPPLTEGQQATLTCTAPGLCSGSPPVITWIWRRNGEKDSHITGSMASLKSENLTVITKRHSSILTFNLSAEHHNTNITCKVSFTDNITTEETKTLTVNYARKPQIFGRTTVKEGDVLNLTCSVDSFPFSVISWSKSGKQTKQQSHIVTKMHGGGEICQQDESGICLFSIINVTAGDAGLYICKAEHLNNTLAEEINVTVTYTRKPQIFGKTTVNEGDVLNLTCSADSFPFSVISWSKSGKQTKQQSHIVTKMHGGGEICQQDESGICLFSIINVTAGDAGLYICKAEHLNNTLAEEINITVTYTRKPQIFGKTTVNEGDVLNLTCSADSFPLSVITWTKVETKTKQQCNTSHNSYSSTENTMKGKHGNDSLSITVTGDNPELYVCTTKHLVNNLQEEINITVTYKRNPQVFGNATVNGGDVLNLNCSIDSSLPSVLKLTKYGTETSLKRNILSEADNSTGIYLQYELANISFTINEEENAEFCICRATYQNSTMEEKIHISMTYTGKPQIADRTTEAVEKGLNLSCIVDSFPPSVINLTKFERSNLLSNKSSELQNSNENLKREQSGIGTFFISSVTAEDAGLYICTAGHTNRTLTEEIKLTVTYKRRPQINGSLTIKEGGVLNLTCSVDSFPLSLVMWAKNVTSINPNNRASFPNSTGSATLVNFNMTVEDSGRYICTATHMNNTVTEYVDIEVIWFPKLLNGSGCVLQSDILTCVCISEGFPLPTIKWPLLKDHTEYSIITMVSNHTVNSTVTVTVKTNAISVECLSSNENGEAKENLTVWTKKEARKRATNSGKRSMLEIIIAFFIGLLISPISYCLFMKCYRKPPKNSGNVDESLEMISPLMSNGEAVHGGVNKETLAAAPEATSGPNNLVYASIDFSLLNRIPRKTVKSLGNTGTEYAEIKTNKEKEGDPVEMMIEEDSEIKNSVQEVKEEDEEAVYSTMEDLVNES